MRPHTLPTLTAAHDLVVAVYTQLERTLRFAPAAVLITLLELEHDPSAGGVDVSDAPEASGVASRAVARLAVREVPAGAQALLVRVSVDMAGALELSCEAEREGGGATEPVGRVALPAAAGR